MSTQQENVLSAIRSMVTSKRPWLPLTTLESYDGRTVAALQRRGLIEVDLEYGVRPAKALSVDEGKIKFAQCDYGWRVNSDIITGKMEWVGIVWWEPDYSIEAKRRYPRPIKTWWSRPRLGGPRGPFKTRKAAAAALF